MCKLKATNHTQRLLELTAHEKKKVFAEPMMNKFRLTAYKAISQNSNPNQMNGAKGQILSMPPNHCTIIWNNGRAREKNRIRSNPDK